MNVYFGENYWGCRIENIEKRPGKQVTIENAFEWMGKEWRIPAVYVCEEGLVVEFCVRIPADEVASFLKKWEGQEEKMSEEERLILELESPFPQNFCTELWINGKKAKSEGGCGASWIPHLDCEENTRTSDDIEEELLLKEYGCSRTDGWSFWRRFYAWPEERAMEIKRLFFVMEEERRRYPGIHFHVNTSQEKYTVPFRHPVSGKEYILTVQNLEQSEHPMETDQVYDHMKIKVEKAPSHLLVMEYSTEPKLPQGDIQLYDCTPSDDPVLVKEYVSGETARVIGGKSGPIAICILSSSRSEHPDWHSACSSFHYGPVEHVEWRMEFRVQGKEKKELDIVI